jgi:enoyl-CoA hydratase/carnithine racemase
MIRLTNLRHWLRRARILLEAVTETDNLDCDFETMLNGDMVMSEFEMCSLAIRGKMARPIAYTRSRERIMTTHDDALITTEARGSIWMIGINRPQKRNAFNGPMLRALSDAYTHYENEPALRCAVVFAHGADFTSGLDLVDIAPRILQNEDLIAPERIDPWGLYAQERTKPVICAIHGRCFTLGIELALACDIRIAAEGTIFAQMEISRGILPFGGATLRAPQQLGWGNAMLFMLTAEPFDAAQALRIGLVQEVVASDALVPRAVAIAERIVAQAPLGVAATLQSARLALREGHEVAASQLRPEVRRLMATDDAQEGVMSMIERRLAVFKGR